MNAKQRKPSLRRQRGAALVTAFVLFTLLAMAGVVYVNTSTTGVRVANQSQKEIQTVNLCDAAAQEVLLNLWVQFKLATDFSALDASVAGASTDTPVASIQDSIAGVGNFAGGVIRETQPDTYDRVITVRTVGWIDLQGTGSMGPNDPVKTVDMTVTFSLARSKVFDYTYFVNNYGWMDGFGQNDLVVNGDMRANGDFNITNGSPTINGSVIACKNNKLSPANTGLVNMAPVKWTDSTYASMQAGNDGMVADNENRWRQDYNPSTFGAQGTSEYETYKDLTYDSNGFIDPTSNTMTGAVVGDVAGYYAWQRTSAANNPTTTVLDSSPTQEVVMPDLSDLSYYQSLSSSYVDGLQTYNDGSSNPNYGKGASLQVWNPLSGSYQTISTNGNISGTVIVQGTSDHPILLHGPVTASQDIVIEGNVSGQGTLYAGRNVHIVGSITYTNKPNFQGSNSTTIDNANQKADMLGLAARGSVIMGDTTTFSASWPLQYMSPPFTIGRYDDFGNWIPPFNCYDTDSTGRMLYQSTISDDTMHSIAQQVNQIDAVLYTNFVGGGNIGTGGTGITLNGSIISKNEAMVVWSLPMRENYDSRIHERSLTDPAPLIDVNLPRSPSLTTATWQDRGFLWTN